MTIEEMCAKPGIYEVTTPWMAARGVCCRVEVAEDMKVYQLNPQGQRDGELASDGWSYHCYATKVEQ